MNACGLWI
jgi:serine/threonine protein kinase